MGLSFYSNILVCPTQTILLVFGGGVGHGAFGVLFSSAAGGAYEPIPIGGGAHRPLTALCPPSSPVPCPALSTSLSFPLACPSIGRGAHRPLTAPSLSFPVLRSVVPTQPRDSPSFAAPCRVRTGEGPRLRVQAVIPRRRSGPSPQRRLLGCPLAGGPSSPDGGT